ncbi:ECF-type sigma factor [Roseiconus lacunae]|uniref:ECF-type sigma factor n=1 Tax=Roseiconus lacunae TaxID=2605694 RepID=UPI001E51A347|nr:ECF-type sigma factor [Roseiconus lacunae]MCD0462132.1 hypothetical protein [Roseiconus lacunae]WRQ53388.1 ECF-type sigma factor [Stieleria sp. HD01]
MQDETPSQFQQRIVDQYFDSLVRFVEARMGPHHRRMADGEDVALSALGSFFDRFGEVARQEIETEGSLWPLIATIASRKALNQVRHDRQQKRGGGGVRGDSVFSAVADEADQRWDSMPDCVVESLEIVDQLLAELPPELATIAQRRLEGCTNAEIAAQDECSVATIERRLKLIRSIWSQSRYSLR